MNSVSRVSILSVLISIAVFSTTAVPTAAGASEPLRLNAAALFPHLPSSALNPGLAQASPGAIALRASAENLSLLRSAPHVLLEQFPLPGGGSVTLDIESFSIFSPTTMVVAMTPAGPVRRPVPDITLYRGRIVGEAGSWAYIAVEPAGMSGTLIVGGVVYHVFTPSPDALQKAGGPVLNVYRSTQDMGQYLCGVQDGDEAEALAGVMRNAAVRQTPLAERDTLLAEIAIDADYEAYQHYKSVQATENYIIARMGESTAIYERDVAVTFHIPFLRTWTTTDPFPGSSDKELLNVFTNYWKTKMDTVSRTLAVMISCKPISAPGVSQGLAWLNVLCRNDLGCAFVKFSMNDGFISGHVGVLAHEIGHNFGSPHTHSCLWNPPIDSCYTAEPVPNKAPCFGTGDLHLILGGGELMSYCHMRYGGANKLNIFRDRVGALVRANAELAPCMIAQSTIRYLTLAAPSGGEKICAGDSLQISWQAAGNNEIALSLSRNDGASYDTLIVVGLPRTARSWVWHIPGNFPPGTRYRIKIADQRNRTLIDSMSASFEVKKGVFITDQTTWRNVCAGEGAYFTVTAEGSGTLTYQWKRDGVPLAGQNATDLSLQNMQPADNNAVFTCVITGDCGSVESKPAVLRVFTMPVIVKQPTDDSVCLGGRAVISIQAEGPNLSYKWLTLGKVFNVNSPDFVIDNVTQADAGCYYCEITSPCGKVNTRTGCVIIPSPTASFRAPVPYQELTAGATFDIRWRQWCLGDVKIAYSLNGGANWTDIAQVPAVNDSLHWTVPVTETQDGVFRIVDAANPSKIVMSPTFIIKRRPEARLSSDEVNFGLVQVGTTASKTLTISNIGMIPLDMQRTDITGTTDVVVTNPAPFSVDPGTGYGLSLEYTPKAGGPLTGMLLLGHNGPGSPDTLHLVADAFVVLSAGTTSRPVALALHQSYPNPVSRSEDGRVSLTYDLPAAQPVRLTLYTLLGTRVQTLYDGMSEAGRHTLGVDVGEYAPGTYLVRLTAGTSVLTRVMHVLK